MPKPVNKDVAELISAANDVVSRWSSGNLAEAVNRLDTALQGLEARERTANSKLLPPTKWEDPDQVCESEYRAIHELCRDMWKQEHSMPIIRGILHQFIDTAQNILNGGYNANKD